MVNWNSRTITVGQIVGGNMKVLKITEKGNVRTFEVELMLPAGFEANPFKITAPVDSQDFPIDQASAG